MEYNWEQIYSEFDKVKSEKEYLEYYYELTEITQILSNPIFNFQNTYLFCSRLATKYEKDIKEFSDKTGSSTQVVHETVSKSSFDLINDLNYFCCHIPLFALNREIKSEIKRQGLGLLPNNNTKPGR